MDFPLMEEWNYYSQWRGVASRPTFCRENERRPWERRGKTDGGRSSGQEVTALGRWRAVWGRVKDGWSSPLPLPPVSWDDTQMLMDGRGLVPQLAATRPLGGVCSKNAAAHPSAGWGHCQVSASLLLLPLLLMRFYVALRFHNRRQGGRPAGSSMKQTAWLYCVRHNCV